MKKSVLLILFILFLINSAVSSYITVCPSGCTYTTMTMGMGNAVDFKFNFNDLPSLSLGAEYSFVEMLYVRMGVILKQDFALQEDCLNGLRCGFGYRYDIINIEYTISTNGVLGFNHIFSISYRM